MQNVAPLMLSDLAPIFRLAQCAYHQPMQLLLSRHSNFPLRSKNGVRQGDPLSTLLFCLYLRDTLHEVSEADENVELYNRRL
jgi:hypothetical protein